MKRHDHHDMWLHMCSRFENTGTPEDRARVIRIRAREAQRLARERVARDNRSTDGRVREGATR